MTIRLSHAQASVLRQIRGGKTTSPPLEYRVVKSLLRKGLIRENRIGGQIFYALTELGWTFI